MDEAQSSCEKSTKVLISARKASLRQQQRPKSPTVTPTRYACKCTSGGVYVPCMPGESLQLEF